MSQAALDFDAAAAQLAKHDGLARVEARHLATIRALRAAAKEHALEHGSVHVDDVRRLAVAMQLHVPSKAWGAIFRGRGWVKIGERASTLVTNRGHVSPPWAWQEPIGVSLRNHAAVAT